MSLVNHSGKRRIVTNKLYLNDLHSENRSTIQVYDPIQFNDDIDITDGNIENILTDSIEPLTGTSINIGDSNLLVDVGSSRVDVSTLRTNTITQLSGDEINIGTGELVINTDINEVICNNNLSADGTIYTDSIMSNSETTIDIGGQVTINEVDDNISITNELICNLINPSVDEININNSELIINSTSNTCTINDTLVCDTINPSVDEININNSELIINSTSNTCTINDTLVCDTINPSVDEININNSELIINSTSNTCTINDTLICDTINPSVDTVVINGMTIQNLSTPTSTLINGNSNTLNLGELGGVYINSNTNLFNVSYLSSFSNVVVLGSPSIPTNVTSRVIILEQISDATFGNPTSSGMIYCDTDNIIKTKNTSGHVIALSRIPQIGQMYFLSNHAIASFTGSGTQRVINPAMSSQTFGSNFAINSTYNFRYEGTATINCRLNLSINYSPGAGAKHYRFIVYLNATVDGSNNVASGTNLFYVDSTSIGTTAQSVCIEQFIADVATNNYFTIFAANQTDTTGCTINRVLLAVDAYSRGTD